VRSSSFAVLKALADGRLRSGPEIATALDIPRTAVSHAMRELAAHGLAVHAVRGSGLRLDAPFDALDAEAIRNALGSRAASIALEVLDECESTNAVLAARAAAGAPSGTALACELQRAGRGRRGAAWYSGLGTSLTLSLLWRFERGTAGLSGLPLAIGVACARALEALGASDVGLKWPNDIVRGEAKLGGILVEVSGDSERSSALIGVGINVRLPAAAKRAIGRPVADLDDGRGAPSRNALAARLAVEIAVAAAAFEREGFGAFRDEWLRRHAWQGRRVRVLAPSRRTVDGVAAGVADDGALIVDTPRGPERFHSAEVNLKLAA
jgi:BirA family transcriptional regulator, biotin operon repressor / biotin---[acetyl-CoA-carboxylase] ligase